MRGIFYGVGVGPGDPEYMTLKAVRVLGLCPVLAVPRTDGKHSEALEIASKAVDLSGKEILFLDFLMTRDEKSAARRHRELAGSVAEKLDAGKNVAMLNLGDPSLYASFGYLREILKERGYETETVAGVTSFCACAAKLGVSLTEARLPLRIVPGDYPELDRELAAPGTKAVMKSGREIARVRRAVERGGLPAAAVENCGMPGERVCACLKDAGGAYFTTVLVGEAPEGKKRPKSKTEGNR